MKDSSRHHYLPEFYIKGFVDSSGKLWVFDKKKNVICKEPKSPKQVFFEWDLNTIKLGNEDVDFIEKSYSKTDSIIAKHIINIRNAQDINSIEDVAHIAYLTTFIAQLFWRTPSNEKITRDMLAFYQSTKPGWNSFKAIDKFTFLNQEIREKLLRPLMSMDVLRDSESSQKDTLKYKILQTNEPIFISDNPILFRKTPTTKDDFSGSLIFPISKRRIFMGLDSTAYNFGQEQSQLVNIALMLQSDKFVACDDRKCLQRFVDGFQYFREVSFDEKDFIIQKLFNGINMNAK